MLDKLKIILLAANIVACSIGVQVMQHHCIWCGGDRLEFISNGHTDDLEGYCCSDHESSHHDCEEKGCCQPKLLKLTTGITTEQAFDLKRIDLKPVVFEPMFIVDNFQFVGYETVENDFWDKNHYPPISSIPSFCIPLRC